MAQNRCPLCGGRILHGECAECGYRLPDEDRLSAPYNLDPEDDRPEAYAPAPEKYEMPEAKASPNIPYTEQDAMPVRERSEEKIPNIKVAPTQTPFNNPYSPNNQNNAPAQNAQPAQQNQQGWQNPYNYNPAQRPTRNPVNPTPTFSPNTQKGLLAALIVLVIMAFVSPFFGVVGLILSGSRGSKLSKGTRKTFTILFIIAIALSNIVGRS